MLYQVIFSFYHRDFPFLYRCSFFFFITIFFSDKEVKEHLSHYLSSARELRPETGHLLQVCQLFVHCWEVSYGITSYLKYSVLLLFTEHALYSALGFDLVLTRKRFNTLFIL